MKDYNDVRQHLLEMLEELDDRLGKITDDVKHKDQPLDQDFSEQAVELENNEVLDAIGNTTRAEVEEIKNALFRIQNGTYGICISCGQPIKKERLNVLPYANYCVTCAEKQRS